MNACPAANFGAVQISAVIITLNEARNIGRCLDSLAGVADEVIVVDSGSTDGTVELAKARGARVGHRDWTNYSAQKNHANSLAQGPYILSLDADEALSPELRESLLEAKRRGLNGAYAMARLTNYCGSWIRHGGWYPDLKVRLFPKAGTHWEGEHVHEQLVLAEGTATVRLKGDLLHYSYASISGHIRQADHFSTLAAQGLFARGRKAGVLKRWFSPPVRFLGDYIVRGGFLDGWHGAVIARISAAATYWKYAKLGQLWREAD